MDGPLTLQSQLVSQSVSDKHSQWSDSGLIKTLSLSSFINFSTRCQQKAFPCLSSLITRFIWASALGTGCERLAMRLEKNEKKEKIWKTKNEVGSLFLIWSSYIYLLTLARLDAFLKKWSSHQLHFSFTLLLGLGLLCIILCLSFIEIDSYYYNLWHDMANL